MKIKGSLFVHLSQASAEKWSWQRHQNNCSQTQGQGQAQDRTRATSGHFKDKRILKRTYEEKPRTSRRRENACKGQPPR